jgi:hypothetical protein
MLQAARPPVCAAFNAHHGAEWNGYEIYLNPELNQSYENFFRPPRCVMFDKGPDVARDTALDRRYHKEKLFTATTW